ncbi:MAG TPA: hypothetical protein VGO76_14400 [Luteibacter sp.]|jgi:hypothetical protein|nr:hypothetical protein [Luteibacter sp.]
MDTGTTQYRTIEYRRRHGERAIYTVTYGADGYLVRRGEALRTRRALDAVCYLMDESDRERIAHAFAIDDIEKLITMDE